MEFSTTHPNQGWWDHTKFNPIPRKRLNCTWKIKVAQMRTSIQGFLLENPTFIILKPSLKHRNAGNSGIGVIWSFLLELTPVSLELFNPKPRSEVTDKWHKIFQLFCAPYGSWGDPQSPANSSGIRMSLELKHPYSRWGLINIWGSNKSHRDGGILLNIEELEQFPLLPERKSHRSREILLQRKHRHSYRIETSGCHVLPHLRNLLFPSPSSSKSSLKNRKTGNC